MADEATDASNKEQFVICLRLVDHAFEVHEEVIGLYEIDNREFKISQHGRQRQRENLFLCFPA